MLNEYSRGKDCDWQGEDWRDGPCEQGPIDAAGSERHHAQPSDGDDCVVEPKADRVSHRSEEPAEYDA